MKSQTAAEVVAALDLARSGWRPARGDLLVVVVVDEETGGEEGAHLAAARTIPTSSAATTCSTRARAPVSRSATSVSTACAWPRRASSASRSRTDGVAGHASMPKIGDNALLKLAPLLERHAPSASRPTTSPSRRGAARGLGVRSTATRPPRSTRCASATRCSAVLVEPMLGVTFAPTRISASEKINVIPSRAELRVDCRTPPGMERGAGRGAGSARSSAATATSSSSSRRSSATARRPTSPLMDAIARLGRAARTPRRASSRRCCRPSPTRARSATRSPTASPTASSRSAR